MFFSQVNVSSVLLWAAFLLIPFSSGFGEGRAASKAVPPILWWFMTSEVVVGGMAIEVEPSHKYSVTCCCHVTDGSRGAVWQNGIWRGSADEAKVCHWLPPREKNGAHWHSLMLVEHWWRPKRSGFEHSEGRLVCFSSGESVSLLLVQTVKRATCRLLVTTGKNA